MAAVIISGIGCFQIITQFKILQIYLFKKYFSIGEMTKHILGRIVPVCFKK